MELHLEISFEPINLFHDCLEIKLRRRNKLNTDYISVVFLFHIEFQTDKLRDTLGHFFRKSRAGIKNVVNINEKKKIIIVCFNKSYLHD